MSAERLYAERDPRALEPHYSMHLSAMTGEGLHAKSDIAAELAFRDREIECRIDRRSNPWGPGDCIAIAAVRYCLGRSSYAVSECCEWLRRRWGDLGEHARSLIRRDIDNALARDAKSRTEAQTTRHPLGMDMDRAEWVRVARDLWGR